MFASSRFGKLHARDRLIARLKLRGDETVLDVGCGHGLLLIAAAKLLPRGARRHWGLNADTGEEEEPLRTVG
jgi:ribosomal protein L11 methylase PrmA